MEVNIKSMKREDFKDNEYIDKLVEELNATGANVAVGKLDQELFARFLVDKGRTVYRKDSLVGGEGDRSAHHSTGHLDGLYDFFGRLVYQIVVVGLQLDSDSLLTHGFIILLLIYLVACLTTSAVILAGASAWCEYSIVELARPDVRVRRAVT